LSSSISKSQETAVRVTEECRSQFLV